MLCKLRATIYCTPDGMFLSVPEEIERAAQCWAETPRGGGTTNPCGKVERALVPPTLCSIHPGDLAHVQSVTPIRMTINPNKPLPIKRQYNRRPEAVESYVNNSMWEQYQQNRSHFLLPSVLL